MTAEETGASFREQILDAARRNNIELLGEILDNVKNEEQIAHIINESRDPLGNTSLHLAAQYGNYEVLDILLDQHGVEVDPVNNLDGDTPLHLAVRYSLREPEHGTFIAEVLIEDGADAKLKNKHGQQPLDLVASDNSTLEDILQAAAFADSAAGQGGVDGNGEQNGDEDVDGEDDFGSASASDDDE